MADRDHAFDALVAVAPVRFARVLSPTCARRVDGEIVLADEERIDELGPAPKAWVDA